MGGGNVPRWGGSEAVFRGGSPREVLPPPSFLFSGTRLSVATPADRRGELAFVLFFFRGATLLEKCRWDSLKQQERKPLSARGLQMFRRHLGRFSDPFSPFSCQFFRGFKKGLADRGGWREILPVPEIQACFLLPFSCAPLEEGRHNSGEQIWLYYGPC